MKIVGNSQIGFAVKNLDFQSIFPSFNDNVFNILRLREEVSPRREHQMLQDEIADGFLCWENVFLFISVGSYDNGNVVGVNHVKSLRLFRVVYQTDLERSRLLWYAHE